MPTEANEGLKQLIDQQGMKIGNAIRATTGLPTTANALPYIGSESALAATAVTASKPVYIDSSSVPQTGDIPFATTMAGVVVSGIVSTALSALNVTATVDVDNVDRLMIGQLVDGAKVTTFTKTGFIRVNITDSGGVVANGEHYIQIGTLS